MKSAGNVLIIGCGYVGRALGRELVARNQQVGAVRRSKAGAEELLAWGVEPWSADITRPETLVRLPGSFDSVVLCVAASGGDADAYRRTYLDGTRNVLDWLSPSPPRKFVYTSSTGVYGQTDGSVVDETAPTEPSSATAELLIATEQLLLEAARERDFPAMILRVAGIYGPERGYWLRQFLSGQAEMDGDGQRVLNMIHRDDVVGAILAALDRGTTGAVYNAADDAPVTQAELFGWLAKRLNQTPPTPHSADSNQPRRRALTSKRVSNRRLHQELGYDLKYPSFREGFEAELARLAENADGPTQGSA